MKFKVGMKVFDADYGDYGVIVEIKQDMILCDWFVDRELKKRTISNTGYEKEKFEKVCKVLDEDIQRKLE